PGKNNEGTGENHTWQPTGSSQWFVNVTKKILQHKTPYSGTRINDGQDEEGFKHDGKMVPETKNSLPASASGKDMRHAKRQRWRATSAVEQGWLSHLPRQSLHVASCNAKSPGGYSRYSSLRRRAHDSRRGVHREIDARLQNTCRDHCNDSDKALEQHGTIAKWQSVPFLGDHLRRSARGD